MAWRSPDLGLGVGCHVVLVDGAPLLDKTGSRAVCWIRGNDSRRPHFREGISRFGALALLGRLDADEIEAEATAQIRKLQVGRHHRSLTSTRINTLIFSRVSCARCCGRQRVAA